MDINPSIGQIFERLTIKTQIYSFHSSFAIDKIQFLDIQKLDQIKNHISKEIMIDNLKLPECNITLWILFGENVIYIIDEPNLFKNKLFFNDLHLMFFATQMEKEYKSFIENSDVKPLPSIQSDNNKKKYLSLKIKISECLIRKSEIKTRKIHDKTNSIPSNANNFTINDFINLSSFTNLNNLYYNINDNILYVLKQFRKDDKYSEKLFKRERKFYEKIDNQNEFIAKYFGSFDYLNIEYIILEYIEGQTLRDFILTNKVDNLDKIKIILQIMFTVFEIHEQKIILRDLKWDNIMINYYHNAILIDFDQYIDATSYFDQYIDTTSDFDQYNDTTSGPIGSQLFSSPEQLDKNEYSFDSDIYSLGLIIHFIISEQNFDRILTPSLTTEMHRNKINLLDNDEISNLPQSAEKFKSFKNIYKLCLNHTPKLRIPIFDLISTFLIIIGIFFDEISDFSTIIFNLFQQWFNTKTQSEPNNENLNRLKIITNNFLNELNTSNNQNNNNTNNNGSKYIFSNKSLINSVQDIILNCGVSNIKIFRIADMSDFIPDSYYDFEIDSNIALHIIHKILLLINSNDDECDHSVIQSILGDIYLDSKYINHNIQKSLYFYDKAAKHDFAESMYSIGNIYYSEKYGQFNINEAIKYFSHAAEKNHVEAQYNIGCIYFFGKYVQIDIDKAIKYYTLAADQNHSSSQYNLGIIYSTIEYKHIDINKAIYYYTLAANQNHTNAQNNLASIYINGQYVKKDIEKALHYYNMAANQNNTEALYNLGIIYLVGVIVSQDINKSIEYLTLSANNNHARAQFLLGKIYETAYLISRDTKKALYYYTLAANNNIAGAQFSLGEIYYIGDFVTKDINKAIYYLSLASNQNDIKASYLLGLIYNELPASTININNAFYYLTIAANQNHIGAQHLLGHLILIHDRQKIDVAIHYLTLAAEKNHAQSQYILGVLFLDNYMNRKNSLKSIHYLTLASKQNHTEAQFALAETYELGISVPIDIDRAIYYYKLIANKNNIKAIFKLGYIYSRTYYPQFDINKAIYYYELAANKNDVKAANNLGYIYFNGINVKKDIAKAIHYFQLAADHGSSKAQFNIGQIYFDNIYTPRDIKKAIHYFTLASKELSHAQCYLGMIYFLGIDCEKNINKGIGYLTLSAQQNLQTANFCLGFIYHAGLYVKRDMEKSLKYYKKSSSFNNQYAKNNLGIIYKHGFNNIPKNIEFAIIYFKEAINQKNDKVSMYNLAHLYLYESDNIGESIELLIKSSIQDFPPSLDLLCIALMKKYSNKIEKIKKELSNYKNLSKNFLDKIINLIQSFDYEHQYEMHKNMDYIYEFDLTILSDILQLYETIKIQKQNPNTRNIDEYFYEGFGIDDLHLKKNI